MFIIFYFAAVILFVCYTQDLKKARLLKNQQIINLIESSSTSKNRKKNIIANINNDLLKVTNDVDKQEHRLHSGSVGVQHLTDILLLESKNKYYEYFEEGNTNNRKSAKLRKAPTILDDEEGVDTLGRSNTIHARSNKAGDFLNPAINATSETHSSQISS